MKNEKGKAALGCAEVAKRARSRGLTIVEMAVVMAVCGVLAALLVPVLLNSRGRARRVVCEGNLGGLGQTYALCLVENNNCLPDAFYAVNSTPEGYEVSFKSIEAGTGNSLFQTGQTGSLICPSDSRADHVLLEEPPSKQFLVDVSYGYNLRLPVGFRNASRVPQPTNTVSFYDGDPGLLVGTWNPEGTLARDSVRPRHFKEANYLFLDGHVEARGAFPARAFDGGVFWAVAPGNGTSEGGTAGWDGSGDTGGTTGGGDEPPGDGEDEPNLDGVIGGVININPNNNSDFEFEMILPDGYTITRDDLHSDDPIQHAGGGFHPDYLEYTGPAASVRLKPKGNGNQNSLTLAGQPYELENKNRYLITSPDMNVRLYNSKRNKQGKAMGKWWIEIDARSAEIEILE